MALNDVIGRVYSALFVAGVQQVTPWVAYAHNRSNEVRQGADGLIVGLTQDAVSVADYTGNAGIVYSPLSPTKVEIAIDKEKYIAFQLEDTDRVQIRFNLFADAIRQAGQEFAGQVAADFRALLAGANIPEAQTQTITLDTAEGTKAERESLHLKFLDMAQDLIAKGYDSRPFVMVPRPLYRQMVQYVSMESGGGFAGLRERAFVDARLSAVYGVDIIPDMGSVAAVASGEKVAAHGGIRNRTWMYAQQLNKPESMRSSDRFADQWRSLNTYGMAIQEMRSAVKFELAVK